MYRKGFNDEDTELLSALASQVNRLFCGVVWSVVLCCAVLCCDVLTYFVELCSAVLCAGNIELTSSPPLLPYPSPLPFSQAGAALENVLCVEQMYHLDNTFTHTVRTASCDLTLLLDREGCLLDSTADPLPILGVRYITKGFHSTSNYDI